MSLKALIDLANNRRDDVDSHVRIQRNEASYERVRQYDREIERRIESKAVSQELLAKTCSL
ncbi:hypothetical protein [Pseudomonas sediminis]|uniref:hypothetical protein n=1 Tax=Pseudomonas sediminis TaxID=1691904 RepID=UPI0031CCA28C